MLFVDKKVALSSLLNLTRNSFCLLSVTIWSTNQHPFNFQDAGAAQVISDLLKPERQNLVIREDRKRGVFVEGLSEWVVRSPAEVYGLMERGAAQRATGATKLNEMSSRSHAVFIIIVEKSTVMAEDTLAAEDEEMEQFRGLAPGDRLVWGSVGPSLCCHLPCFSPPLAPCPTLPFLPSAPLLGWTMVP